MSDRQKDRVSPQDGPSGEGSSPKADSGATSQDRPGDGAASGGAGDSGRGKHEPSHPDDTNEGADDRAEVVEPGGEASPRARES
ncbi:MAG: hypothetical protein ACRDLB_08325 [Actinomycetota bacterium]